MPDPEQGTSLHYFMQSHGVDAINISYSHFGKRRSYGSEKFTTLPRCPVKKWQSWTSVYTACMLSFCSRSTSPGDQSHAGPTEQCPDPEPHKPSLILAGHQIRLRLHGDHPCLELESLGLHAEMLPCCQGLPKLAQRSDSLKKSARFLSERLLGHMVLEKSSSSLARSQAIPSWLCAGRKPVVKSTVRSPSITRRSQMIDQVYFPGCAEVPSSSTDPESTTHSPSAGKGLGAPLPRAVQNPFACALFPVLENPEGRGLHAALHVLARLPPSLREDSLVWTLRVCRNHGSSFVCF